MGALQNEIRRKYHLYPANHMTHLDNLPEIIEAGELRSYNQMRGQAYFNLANEDVHAFANDSNVGERLSIRR